MEWSSALVFSFSPQLYLNYIILEGWRRRELAGGKGVFRQETGHLLVPHFPSKEAYGKHDPEQNPEYTQATVRSALSTFPASSWGESRL